MRIALLGLLVAAVAVGCQVGAQPGRSPASSPSTKTTPTTAKKAEAPKLSGRWVETYVQVGGREQKSNDVWEFGENVLAMPFGKKVEKVAYRVDTSEKPYKIDLGKPDAAEFKAEMLGIYKIEDGVLTLCLGDDKARPKEFVSGKENFTMLFKLSPKKPSDDAKPTAGTTPATKK